MREDCEENLRPQRSRRTSAKIAEKPHTVPPLRFAPVGMTDLWHSRDDRFMAQSGLQIYGTAGMTDLWHHRDDRLMVRSGSLIYGANLRERQLARIHHPHRLQQHIPYNLHTLRTQIVQGILRRV